MDLQGYFEQIYLDILSDIEDNIKPSAEEMRKLYENRVVNLIKISVKQRFAYDIADLAMEGKCKLVDKYWISSYRCGEPKFNSNYGKYGDLMDIDGSHIIKCDINSANIYRLIIRVRDESEWVFEFDREDRESMYSFYKLFYEYLYDDYIRVLMKKRVDEINKIELDNLKRISDEVLNS